jgi:hypothetical protein
MTKQEFIVQLDRGSASLAELPVTAAMLRHMADALRKGDPEWWKRTQKAWEQRKFVAWTEAWALFLTAVHTDVLGDADSPLQPYFPSCGGTAEADPTSVFARYLADLPKEFFDRIKRGHRRTFVASRAPVWMPSALSYFHRRRLPYYLVEIGAGGGLNLAADLFAPPQKEFDARLIAARIGLDPVPLQLEDINDRRWLTAGHFPEAAAEIHGLDRIVDLVAKRMREEAAFIQLAPTDTDQAPAFIAKNIPSDDNDVGLLVYNMGVTARMTDAEYTAFYADMGQLLAPWGDRGLWLEVENVRGEMYSTTFQGLLHRPAGGGLLNDHVMVRFDFVTNQIVYDVPAIDRFLEVAPAPKPGAKPAKK